MNLEWENFDENEGDNVVYDKKNKTYVNKSNKNQKNQPKPSSGGKVAENSLNNFANSKKYYDYLGDNGIKMNGIKFSKQLK